ncbi:hypothetical protein RclHR1_00270006 [Rhizophagus clarus]|uniref:Uncharacterized protein n=1 Tax=Rhizophagus clarus TaxID=94130 RepID=A0A2Z6R1T2_9GLOM|nr:hypothetical protein RclHR1_00270006 [Rhizophagus clarus]
MDIPELNIQESLFFHITSHKEQVEQNDIISQNPESENFSVGCVFGSWEDVDTIIEAYVLTIFNDSHNHVLFSNTEEYLSKYRYISNDILKKIQFFTQHGNLPITTQQKLLKTKFSDQSILDRDLANAIQKFKVKKDVAHD